MALGKEHTRGSVKAGKTSGPRGLAALPAKIAVPRLLFIISVVALCVVGLVMVYSASSILAYSTYGDAAYYLKRQAAFLGVGVVACIVSAVIPYRFWANRIVFFSLWLLTVAVLAATALGLGVSALGAERSIMVGGFAFQPSEFAKITILLTCASLFEMQREEQYPLPKFAAIFIISALVPLLLIYQQPDLGTAIILAVGIMAMCLLLGLPVWILGALVALLVLYVVFACITQPYHLQRIISMIDPWTDPQGDGYQVIQSLYAFGSGGVFGTGLGLSRQKFLYLPYAHTDFIFAIIGEELGLVGATFVALLFGLFIYSGIRISRNAPDILGCSIAGAFTTMIGFQACVNMACVTGIAPVTGKALPFISYGGSSIFATMIMVGLILSVSFRSKVGAANERRRKSFVVIDSSEKPVNKVEKDQSRGNVAERIGNVIYLGSHRKESEGKAAHKGSGSSHRSRGSSSRYAGDEGTASGRVGRNRSEVPVRSGRLHEGRYSRGGRSAGDRLQEERFSLRNRGTRAVQDGSESRRHGHTSALSNTGRDSNRSQRHSTSTGQRSHRYSNRSLQGEGHGSRYGQSSSSRSRNPKTGSYRQTRQEQSSTRRGRTDEGVSVYRREMRRSSSWQSGNRSSRGASSGSRGSSRRNRGSKRDTTR